MQTVKTDADRARQTIDALVDEAYQREVERGVGITDENAWRSWKRGVYIAMAKREGPGYLRMHYQRLGLGIAYASGPACPGCGNPVHGEPCKRDGDDTAYCSYRCAGVETMTLDEWIRNRATPEQAAFMRSLRGKTDGKEQSA